MSLNNIRAALVVALMACVAISGCEETDPTTSLPDAGVSDLNIDIAGEPVDEDRQLPEEPSPDDTRSCGSAGGTFVDNLVELAWDNGEMASSIPEGGWQITVDGVDVTISDNVYFEAVRFELDHPAVVHGFRIQWTGLSPNLGPETLLEAGLYRDFGYNGFDFWSPDPYWMEARCAEDATEGQWLDYVLDQPLVVEHPGLIYVAHRVAASSAPTFAGSCSRSPRPPAGTSAAARRA